MACGSLDRTSSNYKLNIPAFCLNRKDAERIFTFNNLMAGINCNIRESQRRFSWINKGGNFNLFCFKVK